MTSIRITSILVSLPLFVASAACKDAPADTPAPKPAAVNAATAPAPSPVDLVKRGEQLTRIGGCGDCHTPMAFDPNIGAPVPQMDRFLSGHPENGPEPKTKPGAGDQAVIGPTFTSFRTGFGTVYSANLTPDPETGIGAWTEAEFIAAMRTGKHRGKGRAVLPPMPWQNLAGMPEEDLKAMFVYLRSLKPIKNRVKANEVPPEALAAIEQSYEKAKAAAR